MNLWNDKNLTPEVENRGVRRFRRSIRRREKARAQAWAFDSSVSLPVEGNACGCKPLITRGDRMGPTRAEGNQNAETKDFAEDPEEM
jgi:hypothetical protein